MNTRTLPVVAALAAAFAALPAHAQISDNVVRIGVMSDLSGPYADQGGAGSVLATKMAIEDFIAKEKPAFKIETVVLDHQNKADIAVNKAREWFEKDHVDVVTDLLTSSVALGVMKIAKEKNRIALVTGSGSTRIMNEDCNDVTLMWAWDTYSQANGAAREVTRLGSKKWFFLTADYAFGHSLEKDASEIVKANGGQVVGSARHPIGGGDFSSLLLKAQASGADVIGMANAGTDTINAIKQAVEFGITPKQKVAGLVTGIVDVHALGLKTTQGMYLTEAFYWGANEETKAWSKRYFEQMKRMPSTVPAGQYSAVLSYLKAVKAVGSDDTQKVMAYLRKTPVNDIFAKNGRVREDGRMVHDIYLMQVKKPGESTVPWDYYHVRATIPADQANQPLSASRCPMVKK